MNTVRVLAVLKSVVAVVLCLVIPAVMFAAENPPKYSVTYDGGSLQSVKAGTELKLYIDSNKVRFLKDKTEVVSIPSSAITEVSYGQDVHRRVGTAIGLGMISLGVGTFMLFAKSKKHYVGLTWANADQKGGLAMQCDKSEYRGVLAALEGVSGKKAVSSEAMTVKN
jgi:hypothetical protein